MFLLMVQFHGQKTSQHKICQRPRQNHDIIRTYVKLVGESNFMCAVLPDIHVETDINIDSKCIYILEQVRSILVRPVLSS